MSLARTTLLYALIGLTAMSALCTHTTGTSDDPIYVGSPPEAAPEPIVIDLPGTPEAQPPDLTPLSRQRSLFDGSLNATMEIEGGTPDHRHNPIPDSPFFDVGHFVLTELEGAAHTMQNAAQTLQQAVQNATEGAQSMVHAFEQLNCCAPNYETESDDEIEQILEGDEAVETDNADNADNADTADALQAFAAPSEQQANVITMLAPSQAGATPALTLASPAYFASQCTAPLAAKKRRITPRVEELKPSIVVKIERMASLAEDDPVPHAPYTEEQALRRQVSIQRESLKSDREEEKQVLQRFSANIEAHQQQVRDATGNIVLVDGEPLLIDARSDRDLPLEDSHFDLEEQFQIILQSEVYQQLDSFQELEADVEADVEKYLEKHDAFVNSRLELDEL